MRERALTISFYVQLEESRYLIRIFFLQIKANEIPKFKRCFHLNSYRYTYA